MNYEERRQFYYDKDRNTHLNELNGFKRDRGSADFGWCVFFLVFIAGMVATTVYGYKTGKVLKLVAPVDGDNRICGFDKGVEGYPNLYIAKMDTTDVNKLFKSAVCVKKCPTVN
jgi:hypothetical protein